MQIQCFFLVYKLVRYLDDRMITVPKEKCTSFNFIPQMLKDIGHIWQEKIYDQELRSIQNLGYHENV